jgi:hypothetical protein
MYRPAVSTNEALRGDLEKIAGDLRVVVSRATDAKG